MKHSVEGWETVERNRKTSTRDEPRLRGSFLSLNELMAMENTNGLVSGDILGETC